MHILGILDGSRDYLLIKDDLKAKNKLKITVVPQGLHFFFKLKPVS